MYFRIRKYCPNKFLMRNILRKVVFCQKENKQYIFQDSSGGHLGFTYKQDPKAKNYVKIDFIIRNLKSQLILHIVLWRKLKNIYFFKEGSDGHLGFVHKQDFKIRNSGRNEFSMPIIFRKVVLHIVFWQIVQKFWPYWYFWQIKNKMAAKNAI